MLNYHKKFPSKKLAKHRENELSVIIISSIKHENVKFCIQLQQKWLASLESLQKTAYKTFKQFFLYLKLFT
jgi:hypothetical protein